MKSPDASANEFLEKLNYITDINFSNPRFGVSKLAKEMGMSRSNLHKKLDDSLKISASQYINHFRLKKAKEFLRHTSSTVSEIAYKVGFNNVSYFIKCFNDFYGYPPGHIRKRTEEDESIAGVVKSNKKKKNLAIIGVLVITVLSALILLSNLFPSNKSIYTKSIAVLPPQFIGPDSTRNYQVTGAIYSVLDNLSKIGEMQRIIPWISVQHFMNSLIPASEIAKELDVNYIVSSVGMVEKDNINIVINLITGKDGKQIWSNTYNIKQEDMNSWPSNISKIIAQEINAKITPEESERISQIPTQNQKALKLYYKGLESKTYKPEEAARYFKNAIEYDNEFALAYAELALIYNRLDYLKTDKIYANEFEYNADMAMLYNSKLDKSLIAKSYSYLNSEEYQTAILYLENALQYNPNSIQAISILAYIYGIRIQDTQLYLEYRLKQLRLELLSEENSDLSNFYQNLAEAFNRAGFFDKASFYYNKSSETEKSKVKTGKAFLLCDLGKYELAKTWLIEKYHVDSLDTEKPLALAYFNLREYDNAYNLYHKIFERQNEQNYKYAIPDLPRYIFLLSVMEREDEAGKYLNKLKNILEKWDDNLVSKHRLYAAYYCLTGDNRNALKQMAKILEFDNYPYLIIREFRDSPLYDYIRQMPEYNTYFKLLEDKYWDNHEHIKKTLTKQGLLALAK